MKISKQVQIAIMALGMLMYSTIWATNDFIPHGFGMKAKGMGGASIAYQEETHGAGWNPAGLAFIGERFDFVNANLDWFRATQDSSGDNQMMSGTVDYNASQKQNYIMPELGFNMNLRNKLSFGLLVYGNAGMNSSEFENSTGDSDAEIDLSQLFLAPTLTKRFGKQAVGISLNMAYQRFSAKGLENLDSVHSNSANANVISNQGYDYSTGLGGSVGWQGQFTDKMTLGAFYRFRTRMNEFEAYKGLFAENGNIDVPAAFGIGIALHATPKTVVAFDVMKVKYADVRAFTNPLLSIPQDSDENGECDINCDNELGMTSDMGFGWNNQTIYKLGVSYKYNHRLTLRAGFNYSQTPVAGSETVFNQLVPAVAEKHLTLGGTWLLDNRSEISVFYMPAFETYSEENSGGDDVEQTLYQDSFGVSYGWHF